jgi:OmpA-OmpF porin, OOP family
MRYLFCFRLSNVPAGTKPSDCMAINLIDMAKGYLTDAVVSRVSNSLNESPDGIQKALGGAIPMVLGSLISKTSTPEGPGMLTGLLQQFTQGSATAPAGTADDDDPDTMMAKGGGILDSLLGPASGMVSGALAQFSGVSSSSASGLMGMAGSLITGLIGKQLMASGEGINAGSVVSLLASQKDAVAAAMPSGLSALLGNVPGLGGLTGMLGGLTGGIGSALSGATGGLGSAFSGAGTSSATTTTPAYTDDDRKGGGFNFWPWLLAALAAGLIYYFVKGCDTKAPADTAALTDTTSAMMRDATATADSAAATMGAMADSAGSAISSAASDAAAALGAFGAKRLPDGVELNIPANGIENQLIAFIEDGGKAVDKTTWFNFDRLLFETGSAKLVPSSREQLQNIAAILKAYPAVNLKIGGYTDNTGSAASNKNLSQSRAETTMQELTALGVAATRLEAEGYGSEHPVATNDTAEGRAQNRRIACRVTKK